ncbi:hypothetical protein A4A37_16505 [Bacillus subtilis]|nr:hypothetical protein A4A37_16505 [Bacillus subtilis]
MKNGSSSYIDSFHYQSTLLFATSKSSKKQITNFFDLTMKIFSKRSYFLSIGDHTDIIHEYQMLYDNHHS